MLRPVWRTRSNPRGGSFLKPGCEAGLSRGLGEPVRSTCNLLKSRKIRYLHKPMQRRESSLLFSPTVKLLMRNSEPSRSQSLWGLASRAFANSEKSDGKFNT